MPRVALTASQRKELEGLCRRGTTQARLHRRATMVLLAARGATTSEIASRLGTNRYRVGLWLDRYLARGVAGLADLARRGRPKTVSSVERHRVIAAACQAPRKLGHQRDLWSLKALSLAVVETRLVRAISASTVGRILRRAEIKPHRVKMWCHSKDPAYQDKLNDIVGLYLNLPAGEPVLCIDEKSGMQALSRARGLVRVAAGRRTRLEFEYRRNGTRCLFGCFNVRTGELLGRCSKTRKRADFLEFMDLVASKFRQPRVHVVLDNLNIHHDTKAGDFISQWNRAHGNRFVFHYTPTHGSWLNQVELWFGILTKRVLRHASFANPEALVRAVDAFVAQWNEQEAHPFRWTYEGVPLAS